LETAICLEDPLEICPEETGYQYLYYFSPHHVSPADIAHLALLVEDEEGLHECLALLDGTPVS
jgi:hypothetical protein